MKGGIQMKINITPPRHYSDFHLHSKTKKYMRGEYNKLKARNVFEGEKKGYNLYITKKNIQIELIDNGKETVNEIERYLEFLFYDQYIGVSFEGTDNIQLGMKNVKCFYL